MRRGCVEIQHTDNRRDIQKGNIQETYGGTYGGRTWGRKTWKGYMEEGHTV